MRNQSGADQTNGCTEWRDLHTGFHLQAVYLPVKNDILHVPGVKQMAASSNVMGQEILWSTNWKALHEIKLGMVNVFQMAIDYDFYSRL